MLAVATFSSVKSANRSARVAERALLVGMRPVPAAAPKSPTWTSSAHSSWTSTTPAGDSGFWQGAMRDPAMPGYDEVRRSLQNGGGVRLDLLYGDHEGGQRTIARFVIAPWPTDDDRLAMANPMRAILIRYWTVDGHGPR